MRNLSARRCHSRMIVPLYLHPINAMPIHTPPYFHLYISPSTLFLVACFSLAGSPRPFLLISLLCVSRYQSYLYFCFIFWFSTLIASGVRFLHSSGTCAVLQLGSTRQSMDAVLTSRFLCNILGSTIMQGHKR